MMGASGAGFYATHQTSTVNDSYAEKVAGWLRDAALRLGLPPLYIVVLGTKGNLVLALRSGPEVAVNDEVPGRAFWDAYNAALTAISRRVDDTWTIAHGDNSWPEHAILSAIGTDPHFVAVAGGLLMRLKEAQGGSYIGAIGVAGCTEDQARRLCQEWFLVRVGAGEVYKALSELDDRIASSEGEPVHGTPLSRFGYESAAAELIATVADWPQHCLDFMDGHRRQGSHHRVGYRLTTERDFPPELRESLDGALLLARAYQLPGRVVGSPGAEFAFAILPDGMVVTSNEPCQDGPHNPWDLL